VNVPGRVPDGLIADTFYVANSVPTFEKIFLQAGYQLYFYCSQDSGARHLMTNLSNLGELLTILYYKFVNQNHSMRKRAQEMTVPDTKARFFCNQPFQLFYLPSSYGLTLERPSIGGNQTT